MSNYYTKFCSTLERVSEEESGWLREKLREMEKKEGLSFDCEFTTTSLCLQSDEQLPDELLTFLQMFFQEKRPNEYILIDYACTADRPSEDAYAGGTVFVSAHTISWSDTNAWKKSCVDELSQQANGPLKEADSTE